MSRHLKLTLKAEGSVNIHYVHKLKHNNNQTLGKNMTHIDLSKTKSEMSSVGFASVTQYNMM